MPSDASFASRVAAWQRRHGRKNLPWQGTRDPYRVWLSEIMLQQTQVGAVIPYYDRFLRRFPDVQALAAASQEEVLRLWSGLGYYARGRNLHRAARMIAAQPQALFPRTVEGLQRLPGVGRSTAAAIGAFAFGLRAAILDGNVKRVLARWHGAEGWPGDPAVQARLWRLAEGLLPPRGIETYTQGLMDLGATLCTRRNPRCEACPVRADCAARKKRLVHKIPGARPRKAMPQRSATWLLLVSGNEILLERRPPAGLWGGLWTFPEHGGGDIAAYCKQILGCKISAPHELAPLEHAFTHFRLRIRPVLCPVERIERRAGPAARIWIGLEEAAGAAVPTPVRRLLEMHSGAVAARGHPPARAAPASRRGAAAGSRRGER